MTRIAETLIAETPKQIWKAEVIAEKNELIAKYEESTKNQNELNTQLMNMITEQNQLIAQLNEDVRKANAENMQLKKRKYWEFVMERKKARASAAAAVDARRRRMKKENKAAAE